jgi:hypothetical protein
MIANILKQIVVKPQYPRFAYEDDHAPVSFSNVHCLVVLGILKQVLVHKENNVERESNSSNDSHQGQTISKGSSRNRHQHEEQIA